MALVFGKPSPSTELIKATPCLSIRFPIVFSAFSSLALLFPHYNCLPSFGKVHTFLVTIKWQL